MKTKRNGATGIAVRNLFTVMMALLLVIGFNACSNSGGGGGPSGDGRTGSKKDKNSKDWEEGGKYWNEEEGRAYGVRDEISNGGSNVVGEIFYFNPDGFIMTDTGERAYYLVAHPDTLTGKSWASSAFFPSSVGGTGSWLSIDGTEEKLGSGRKNTALILAKDLSAPAAKACKDIELDAGWFLPSLGEFKIMVDTQAISNFEEGSYWTSTQADDAHSQLGNGTAAYYLRNNVDYVYHESAAKYASNFKVRAVRAF